MRVENRLPGADANPYLAIAASLLCGYLGMVERIEPSAAVQGRAYERRNLRLPITIEDALTQMEECETIGRYLGSKFVRGLCRGQARRARELQAGDQLLGAGVPDAQRLRPALP